VYLQEGTVRLAPACKTVSLCIQTVRMENFEDDKDLATDDQQPLLRPLADVQVTLLETIWHPVVDSVVSWPVWDYVTRKMYRQNAQLPPASSVLASLPTVPVGIQRAPYGLVWRADRSTIDPLPAERVGLSIAGLLQLGEHRQDALELADRLAMFIGYAANWERELTPDPSSAVELTHKLDGVLPQLLGGSRPLSQVASLDVLEVLQREFAPLNLRFQGDGKDARLVLRTALAPFHGVSTAREYVDRISAQQRPQPPVEAVPPLYVAQMLDYLSLVLASHPNWPARRLIDAPDLRAAASLALSVSNEAEYRDRMSALSAVLNSLRAPDVPEEVVSGRFGGQPPASLQRLKYWLEINLADADSRQQALQAVENLRSIVALRNEGQHPSSSQRLNAAAARRRLGLPDLILDWGAAWDLVRTRVAEASDVISREVRFAS
jgi:hypothetical protein